jgi:hypothetical protein
MMAAEIEPAHALPMCARCGDVIGVYDPLVHVSGERARRTSRAAEPEILNVAGRIYHEECYHLAMDGN